MNFDGTKLIYSDGRPQWLMPDGSFVPAKQNGDGSVASALLYLRDKKGKSRRICG